MHAGLVFKATRRCNLRCHYCNDWRSGPEFDMSFETVARATAAVLHHPDVNSILFTWHGGEPMLLPLDFYRRALEVQSRLRREDQRIGNAVQTNGTLLNDERCQFLADNRFYVGVSIDGPSFTSKCAAPLCFRPRLQRNGSPWITAFKGMGYRARHPHGARPCGN